MFMFPTHMKKARCFSLFPWIYFSSTISLIDHHHFHVAAPSCFAFISSFLYLFHILQVNLDPLSLFFFHSSFHSSFSSLYKHLLLSF
ncbi:hypothetical protein RchiOBHm_Chr1g0333671 [Rosa chinensis]|uniref:Uncharacterized protein n=1 Tax=Rosa chinensis TaxID=74649 RepID=A0A2P6SC58_ROSCH|nr:hypothetical protein RchiOBHm_Chr4g0418011 [Rosa chinensis]PRQ56247.1 hypothetical protein RchiOBHm_Chr1g0333671 [Rosa chinensis]